MLSLRQMNFLVDHMTSDTCHMTDNMSTHFFSFLISSNISMTLVAFSFIILNATCSSPTTSNLEHRGKCEGKTSLMGDSGTAMVASLVLEFGVKC